MEEEKRLSGLIFDLGVKLGVMRGSTRYDADEEPADKLNTYVTRAVDSFKSSLAKIGAEGEAVDDCRKRVDEFKELWDGHYVQRKPLIDEASNSVFVYDCVIPSPDAAREALDRLRSAVDRLLEPHGEKAGHILEFAKCVGEIEGVFVAVGSLELWLGPEELDNYIKTVRDHLKSLEPEDAVQKKTEKEINNIRKAAWEDSQDWRPNGWQEYIGSMQPCISEIRSIIAEEASFELFAKDEAETETLENGPLPSTKLESEGLPISLEELAKVLIKEKGEGVETNIIKQRLMSIGNRREPSKIIHDNKARWGEWIDKNIGRQRGLYWWRGDLKLK